MIAGGGWSPANEPIGLVRQRLTHRLLDPTRYSVGRVVAPGGSGKSRLLAHIARDFAGPVAWCGSPDPVPRSAAGFVAWVWPAVSAAIGTEAEASSGAPPEGVDTVVDLVAGAGPTVLLVVDDTHLLEGSDAETALADLIRRMPPRLRVLIAGRANLNLDVSRLRVSGKLVEIGPDDLRFRTWEVEELFRDVYENPLLPEDAATLARRSSGWAAYLQLFHLATARKPQGERRRVLDSLASRSRLVQEYLARHVLADLAPELQDFLVRTSVLRRPTGAMCDELLAGPGGSAQMLAELARRQLFTERVDAEDAYRYHPVLLSFLDAKLVETVGLAAAREAHDRAALLLEREGFGEDALAAFARAEDWQGVARVLGHPDSAAGLGDAWLEALPPAVVESDSLLLLARARRMMSSGALADAVRTMRDAEKVAVSAAVVEKCRRERDQISAWASSERASGPDWPSLVRASTQRDPREAQRRAAALVGPAGRLAEGLTAFMGGDMLAAARVLRSAASHPGAAPAMAALAGLVAMIAAAVCGRIPTDADIERLRDEVEGCGVPWLDRIASSAMLTGVEGTEQVLDDLAEACEREGDRWGAAFVALMTGSGMLWKRQPALAPYERAAVLFGDLGAGVLEATALAYVALAAHLGGQPELAKRVGHQARTLSALVDSPWASGLAALALGEVLEDERELARARSLLEPLGIWEWHVSLALPRSVSDGSAADGTPGETWAKSGASAGVGAPAVSGAAAHLRVRDDARLRLRCLGGFALEIDGRTVDEAAAKPMERSLLHLLALKAGAAVHREELVESLWPEADPDAGVHRLQVAVSSLRRLVGPGSEGVGHLLAREGDSYRLALPAGADVDLWRLTQGVRRAVAARAIGDAVYEDACLAEALAAYGGPLLPGDGPADWVVGPRGSLQATAADASIRLANLRLDAGRHLHAAEAARSGLAVDRYRDELWQVLIEAAERSGHQAEAVRARHDYAAVLDELGV
ncbi:MAG: BTAD domain-containing putative transcriptional regulator [Acidimicrobiales bacterium]